jgi:hypothetical protein
MSASASVGSHVLGREVFLARSMTWNPDRVLVDEPPATAEQAAILVPLYHELCSSWRELIGVRFKLLGLVPAVSAVALGALLRGDALSTAAGLGITLFGLAVTLALFVYDQRNSQLHDELISRGRRIEFELGITVGQFLGRPGSWRFVKHDNATNLVYAATIVAWIMGAVVFAA